MKKYLAIAAIILGITTAYATITSTTTRTVTAVGNGVTTNYTIGFVFQDNDQLRVYRVVTATGVATLLTEGGGAGEYTVTGGDPGTTVVMGTAPTAAQFLVISRVSARTQPVNYDENSAFPAADHEEQLDKMQQVIQELDFDSSRTAKQSVTDTATVADGDVLKYESTTGRWDLYDLDAAIAAISAGTASNSWESIIPTAGDTVVAASSTDTLNLVSNDSSVVITGTAASDELNFQVGATLADSNIDAAAAIARTKLASGSNNHVLINDGSGVMSSEATLDETRGGTGQTTISTGDILYGSAANTISKLAAGTNGHVLTLAAGIPSWAASSGSGAGGIFAGGQNLITNNSAEVDTTGWTASGGGTLTRVTTAAHIIPPGVASFSWDPSAASETLSFTSTTVTSNDGLSGRNGVLSCAIKTAATDMKMQAYDGSNVLTPNDATDLVPSSSTGFRRYSLNFIIPASGTIQARFLSASNSAIAYIDDCFFGLAEGFNISNVSQASMYGTAVTTEAVNCSWLIQSTSYTSFSADTDCNAPTVTGSLSAPATKIPGVTAANLPPGKYEVSMSFYGNVSGNSCMYRLTDGTTTSPEQLMGGSAKLMTVTGVYEYTTAQSSVTWQVQARNNTAAQDCIIETNASAAIDNDLNITVKRFPNSSNTLLSVDTSAASWSGYHDSTCKFTRTNASYGDPAADATCTFTERKNTNFGTVTSYLSGSDKLPGIVFTPPYVGKYYICANAHGYNSSGATSGAYRLTDGTTVIDESGWDEDTVSAETRPKPLCGVYEVSSISSKTIKIETKASSGIVNLDSTQSVPVIGWIIFGISQSLPAPLLVGSVTSNSSGLERTERLTMTNSGTPTVSKQSGSWISSITDNGVGSFTLVIASGIFSDTPTCTCTPSSSGGTAICSRDTTTAPSSTAMRFITKNDAGAAGDYDTDVICMGPR